MKNNHNPERLGARRHAAGVVLIIALIALVAMTLAALALVRSVGTGLEISGNLAFKEASTSIADLGVETGVRWLVATNKANSATLYDNGAAGSGYYANMGVSATAMCDLTGNATPADPTDDVVWDSVTGTAKCGQVGKQVTNADLGAGGLKIPDGYTVYYIINRMSSCAGDPTAPYCKGSTSTPINSNPYPDPLGGTQQSTKVGGGFPLSGGVVPYYRITTKVVGPRNTVSYTQALVTLR